MIFRKATLIDIEELIDFRIRMRNEREDSIDGVELDKFKENSYKYFQEHISDNSFISWVVEENGKIEAVSGISFYFVPPTYSNTSGEVAYIMNMYTNPCYRRKGIATKLLDLLVKEAEERKLTKVILNASDMGRHLYEKYGFKDGVDDMVYYIS